MKRLAWMPLLVVFLVAMQLHANEQIGAKLQDLSVTIRKSGNDRGSGVIVTRMVGGKQVSFILTCAHVVEDLRVVKDVIATDGTPRKEVTYREAEILQELREDGRRAGKTVFDVEILNVDTKRDLALLRVRKTGLIKASAKFYLGKEIPAVGREVYYCGSPGGQSLGAASLTHGIISQVGRTFEEYGPGEWDQTDCAGLPGSSGGGVYDAKTGELLGIVSLGIRYGDSFHYMIPVRRICHWAKEIGVWWLLDEKTKPPTADDLKKIPLENQSLRHAPKEGKTEAKSPCMKPADLELHQMIWAESEVR